MVIDRVLTIAMDLAIVALVLIVVSQAIGQFDSVLKTVLRPPKDEPVPESVSQWRLPLLPWRSLLWLYSF
jgi:hypothetical protein